MREFNSNCSAWNGVYPAALHSTINPAPRGVVPAMSLPSPLTAHKWWVEILDKPFLKPVDSCLYNSGGQLCSLVKSPSKPVVSRGDKRTFQGLNCTKEREI